MVRESYIAVLSNRSPLPLSFHFFFISGDYLSLVLGTEFEAVICLPSGTLCVSVATASCLVQAKR